MQRRVSLVFLAAAAALAAAGAASARADGLDLKRYMPLSEVRPGMTGVGKTTLQGTAIAEFQVTVRAVLHNVGPKWDVILVECRGAGLEETGVIAGMSGSPVYIDGRLVGAVAFSFLWGKLPIAGVQPIEQMLRVTDEHAWAGNRPAQAPAAAEAGAAAWEGFGAAGSARERTLAARGAAGAVAPGSAGAAGLGAVPVPVAAMNLAQVPPELAGRATCDMHPIRTPVTVSGASAKALDVLRRELAPLGLVPMQGGAVDHKLPVAARLEPGAPLGVVLMRGDMDISGMGTITEIAGDRLYGLGHAMFGLGEANYPLTTGVAHLVVPTMVVSFRLGAPVEEVGRLTWDENTAVVGRLTKERAPMVPVAVTVRGPDPGEAHAYRFEMIDQRLLSPLLAAVAALESLQVRRELPVEHTVAYRIRVKPAGREPIVHENLVISPGGDIYVMTQVRSLVGLLMDNPYENLRVESVEVEADVEPRSRLAEIRQVRLPVNAVRPGTVLQAQLKVRPWREEPLWMTVPVQVPADYPDGVYELSICGGDAALRREAGESPARFRVKDLESMLRVLRYGLKRDRMYVRLAAPGEGIAIGRDELPNLPPSMRSILSGAARDEVASIRRARVEARPVPYVLVGDASVQVTVDRRAPKE